MFKITKSFDLLQLQNYLKVSFLRELEILDPKYKSYTISQVDVDIETDPDGMITNVTCSLNL